MIEKNDIKEIFAIIKSSYPNFCKDINTKYMTMVFAQWYEVLKDLDKNLVIMAINKHICSNNGTYVPSLHDLRKKARELINKVNCNDDLTADEAWQKVLIAIKNNGVRNQDKIHKEINDELISKMIKGQIKEIGFTPISELGYIKHDFMKQYEIFKNREVEDKLLPTEMKNKINIMIENNEQIKKLLPQQQQQTKLKLVENKNVPKDDTDFNENLKRLQELKLKIGGIR